MSRRFLRRFSTNLCIGLSYSLSNFKAVRTRRAIKRQENNSNPWKDRLQAKFKNKITIISEIVSLFELAQVLGAGELGTLDSGPETSVPHPHHAHHGNGEEISFKVFQLQILTSGFTGPSQESDNVF